MKSILAFFIFLTLISFDLKNISAKENLNPSDYIFKNQQRHWDEFYKEKEIEDLKKELIEEKKEKQKQEKDLEKSSCFEIKEIKTEGNEEIESEEFEEKILNKHKNKCLSLENINQIIKEINNLYIKEGHLGTQVYLPEQNIKSGKLIIKIKESFIEEIKLQQEDTFSFLNKPFEKLQLFTAMPLQMLGFSKNLNIETLENATDVFNRLQTNNAKIQIQPGKKLGGSILTIVNKPKNKSFFNSNKDKFEFLDRTKISANFDNSGLDRVGVWRQSYSLSQDNLLNLNDNLNLYFSGTMDQFSKSNSSRAFSLNYSIPFGRWIFTFNTVFSNYNTFQNGINRDFGLKGDTQITSLKTERMMLRGIGYKLSFFNKISLWKVRSYLENTLISNNSRDLTTMENGMSGMIVKGNSFLSNILYFNISHIMGLTWLKATKDHANQPSYAQSAQFHKIRASLNNYIPFEVFKESFSFNTTFSGQYAFNTLFTQEQIAIGDRYSVRGFQNQFLIADTGFFIRNEITYDLLDMTNFLQKPESTKGKLFNLEGVLSKFADNIKFFVGFDYGYTRMRSAFNNISGQNTGHLAGFAVGIRTRSKFLTFDLTFAKPIIYPAQLKPSNFEIYFNTGVILF